MLFAHSQPQLQSHGSATAAVAPLAIVVAALAVIVVAVLVLWVVTRDSGPESGGGGWGGGTGGPIPPSRPPPAGPGWWPEFERDFAAYVASRAHLSTTIAHREGRNQPP